MDIADRVQELLEQAASTWMLPRWRSLVAGDVEEKSPGEVVTVVDHEVEAFLGAALVGLLPDSVVVGEEACHARPQLLDAAAHGTVWLLDPLDGTRNFAEGRPDFGILLALLREGECIAGWMYQPLARTLYRAERGGGAWQGGRRLRAASRASDRLRGIVKTRFLPPGMKERTTVAARDALAEVQEGTNCTVVDYPRIVSGQSDFAFYWRTLPWDHAPCALFLQEAGGHVARPDGSPYVLTDKREGLLAACSEAVWHEATRALRLNPA